MSSLFTKLSAIFLSLLALIGLKQANLQKAYISPTKVQAPNSTQLPAQETPKYAAIVLSRPTVINEPEPVVLSGSSNEPVPSGKISIPIEIKNISASPFITSFYISDCKFLNKEGGIYPIGPFLMFDNVKFNKAILPGASIKTDIVSDSFRLSMQKCSYNASGENICKKQEFSHIESCNVFISTNDNPPDRYTNNPSPLVVTFPQQ